MAQAPALPGGFELPLEPRLPRIGSVDAVALEERAASLAKRSIKKDAKVWALQLAIRCTDLTTLEGADTPGKVAALCSKAIRPDPSDAHVPSVAAVCVYPNLVPVAVDRLRGTGIHVASVATGFPSGQYPTDIKIADARRAVEAGADFIKTSTGKVNPAATLPVALCMLEAIRDVHEETGRLVGFKPAGGVRAAKQAIQHLVLVNETVGPDWLTPELYRIGASSLLNDILMQLRKEKTGAYQSPDYFTLD